MPGCCAVQEEVPLLLRRCGALAIDLYVETVPVGMAVVEAMNGEVDNA